MLRQEQVLYERRQKRNQEESGWPIFLKKTGVMWKHQLCSTGQKSEHSMTGLSAQSLHDWNEGRG